MFNEIVNAMKEFQDAKYDLMCAESRFNYVHPDFFEIANTDLTIAQQRYENAERRLKMVCGGEDKVPQYAYLY